MRIPATSTDSKSVWETVASLWDAAGPAMLPVPPSAPVGGDGEPVSLPAFALEQGNADPFARLDALYAQVATQNEDDRRAASLLNIGPAVGHVTALDQDAGQIARERAASDRTQTAQLALLRLERQFALQLEATEDAGRAPPAVSSASGQLSQRPEAVAVEALRKLSLIAAAAVAGQATGIGAVSEAAASALPAAQAIGATNAAVSLSGTLADTEPAPRMRRAS